MNEQHFPIGSTTKTTSVQSLARAFFISLFVHAALFGILWQIVATLPRATPDTLRIELTPRTSTAPVASAAASAQTPQPTIEPKPERAARVISARSDRRASTPPAIDSRTPQSVASSQGGGSPSIAPDPIPAIEEAAIPLPSESTIDLRVLDWLARHRDYPLAARRAHIEGVVQLRVTLMPDGRLVDATVAHSSGHPLLDRAALDLLARASPLPAEFASGRTAQIELQLPIVYRMRASST
jgi:protein TonB